MPDAELDDIRLRRRIDREGPVKGLHAFLEIDGLDQAPLAGRRVANDRQAVPGTNIPRSTLDDGGYTLMSLETSSTAGWWNGDYNPAFIFGKQNGNVESGGAILLPEEAWNIDTKMDDARPGTGKVRTYRNSSNCNTSLTIGDQATSEYALATSVAACSLIFAISDPGV